jgi:hypothetical protein
MVYGVLILIYIIVYSCSTMFWCVYGVYFYTCLVACVVDVIHTEGGNNLILLYSRVEFYFVSMKQITFYIRYSNYCIVR